MSDNHDARSSSDTHVVVARHHVRWGALIGVAVVGLIAVGAFYLGDGSIHRTENGTALVTLPSFDAAKRHIVVKNQETAETKVYAEVPSQANPNGQASSTKDGFGSEGKLQRETTNVDRYDPIERLASTVASANTATNEAIKNLGHTVGGQIGALNGKVDGAINRIAALEAKPAAPVPTSQPAPQSQATPAPVPPAPVSQARPIGPQSQAQPNTRLAQSGSEHPVLFDGTALPKGWHVTGVEPGNADKTCTKAMGMKLVMSSHWVIRNGRKFFPNECVPIGDNN